MDPHPKQAEKVLLEGYGSRGLGNDGCKQTDNVDDGKHFGRRKTEAVTCPMFVRPRPRRAEGVEGAHAVDPGRNHKLWDKWTAWM